MGHLPRNLSRKPQHAPFRFTRQDLDHLELDPRRELLRLPKAISSRPLSHRFRLRMSHSGGIVALHRCIFNTETESRSSPLTVPTLSLPPGTRLSASGSLPLVPPPADLLDTPTMSSPSPSPPITDKLSPDLAIEPSSSGTLSVTASSPSPRRDTPTGSRAFDSAQTPKTRSLSAVVGTSLVKVSNFLLVLPQLESMPDLYDATQSIQYLLLQSLKPSHETNQHQCTETGLRML